MTAFVDESIRLDNHGIYVVAAVVVVENLDTAREVARSVLVKRQPRFHWRNEGEPRRLGMLERMSSAGIGARVYVQQPVTSRRPERARALCLNAMLWDLWQAEVEDVVFESRQRHADAADRRLIIAAQQAHRASPHLSYRFEKAINEPLLWMADALAGATSSDSAEGTHYLDCLGGMVARTDVGV